MEGLGVVGVGAPGMPPAAAREPTAVALQRKTSGLRTGAAAAAAAAGGSHDSSSAVMAEVASVNYAAGLPHHDTPVRRRPRAGDAATAAAVRDSSDLALNHFSIESGDNSLGDAYAASSMFSPGAGPQAFQLKWPLQPQPVNSAHSHLSNAAAKISAAADRYSSAVGTSKLPNAQSPATSGTIPDRHSSLAGIGKATNGQSPPSGGIPTEGRRSSLSRRSNQSSAHSSTRSSELGASVQSDPFASRPLLAHDMMVSSTPTCTCLSQP